MVSFLDKVQLFFHTLRHLKLTQVAGRIVFLFHKPKPDLRPPPEVRNPSLGWVVPAARRGAMLSPTRFYFLNEAHDVSELTCWHSTTLSKLWLYNLHYFDFLNAEGAAKQVEWHNDFIARWVAENPPGLGTGWEPYPLSLRITNWIKWTLTGNSLTDVAKHSLAIQIRFLTHRLERHLLGNHLFANAKALVFAGCFFDGEEANGWLRLGLEILENEVPEQILADGGHFERSTMYHALAYEDMLDLLNLSKAYPERLSLRKYSISTWPEIVTKMGKWLNTMVHPDGEISFFNDAAIGVAPSPSKLFSYANRIGLMPAVTDDAVVELKPSGYIRVALGQAVLIIDAAPVGPDYLPGHAHADTLSFELSLFKQRVVVNSGTSCYGIGPVREWERSTQAHSTLTIDGENSSEVWAGFRVARRAYPIDISVKCKKDAVVVEAAHDGYRRLPGRPVHRRRWVLSARSLEITDVVEGRCASAIARIHFHPDIRVELGIESDGVALWKDKIINLKVQANSVVTKRSYWAPEFGVKYENVCLEVNATRGQVNFSLQW